MLKTMHDKKTYLTYIHKQFVLPKSFKKENKEFLYCLKIIFQKYITTKKKKKVLFY